MVDSVSKDRLMEQGKAVRRRRKEHFNGRDGTEGEQKSVDHHDGMPEEVLTERNMLASVIGAINDGLTIRDLEYTLTFQNDYVTNVFGNGIGEKCYSVFQGRDTVCEGCPVELAFKDGKPHTSVRKVVLDTGEITYWQNTASPIRNADGKITSCLEVNTNITEHKWAEEALQESEQRYRTIFDSSRDAMFITAEDAGFVEVNEAASVLTGYSREELTKMTIPDLHEEEDTLAYKQFFHRIMSGEQITSEAKILRKDATKVDTEFSNRKIMIGDAAYMHTIARDITERKKSEERQRLAAQVLELLNKSDEDTHVVRDLLLTIQEFTGFEAVGIRLRKDEDFPYYETSGFPADFVEAENRLCAHEPNGELIRTSEGEPCLECMCGNVISGRTDPSLPFFTEGGSFWTNSTAELLASSTEKDRQSPLRNRCNSAGYESVALIPLHADDETIGLLQLNDSREGMFTAETICFFEEMAAGIGIAFKRKQVKAALKVSEEKHRSMIELAPNVIVVLDKHGVIVSCNSAVGKMSGLSKEELIGKHFTKLDGITIKNLPRYVDVFAEILKGNVPELLEVDYVLNDGSSRTVEVRISLLRDGGIQAIATDITERKQAQQRLLDDREQLRSLASQLSLTEERERQRLATELHDQVGQSLVISKAKLDQLRQSASPGESADVLKEVCSYLEQIIRDTRTLTFDLSHPILYELGIEAAVAEWLVDEIQEKHGIETEFKDDNQPKPLGDDIKAILFRNVRELLINVVKHAGASNVKVSISKVDEQIRISIADDGVGFDQVEVEATAAGKAAFGLFSIRASLEQLGGLVEIDAEPGRGSRISMTAPLEQTEIEDAPQTAR